METNVVVKCPKCDVEVILEITGVERTDEKRVERCDLPKPLPGTPMRVRIPVKVTIPKWCCPDLADAIAHLAIFEM